MLYAVVDIETTGSYAAGSGITEIAIIIHDGERTLDTYASLVNPHRPIPRFIQSLTGITPDMVAGAPAFSEIAAQVHELLQDKIFVAHNVNFDYSFVKHHLDAAGYKIDARKLCTVRLARKVAPGHRSYSLGKICSALEIPHTGHHRALGDAAATAHLLAHLIQNDTAGHREAMLKGRNKEQYLPPNLPVDMVDALPESPGVYYFYNSAGKVIYIGKAINLHARVKSHFSNNKPGRQKQDFLREVARISFEPVANDLMAQVLESVEIRRLWPIHNRSQRGYHPKFGLFVYEDRNGFKRLALDNNKQHYKPIHSFNSLQEGNQWMRQLLDEFGLCARLCNLGKDVDCTSGKRHEYCTAQCPAPGDAGPYNLQVDDAVQWVAKALPTLILLMPGRDETEQSCILIDRGVFYGMGYLQPGYDVPDAAALKQQLTPYDDNDFIRNLVYKYATEHPEHCVKPEALVAV